MEKSAVSAILADSMIEEVLIVEVWCSSGRKSAARARFVSWGMTFLRIAITTHGGDLPSYKVYADNQSIC
jgi:hypothetical protein